MAKRSTYPIKRKKRIIITLSIISILAVVGSVSGTYAWYEYEARAGLKFHGTSVGDESTLDIGLFSNVNLDDYEQYGLSKDENIDNLYWSSEGLSSDALTYYSKTNGYAHKQLTPVTSGSYVEGGDFSLKSAPAYLMNYNAHDKASQINYFNLPLAFRPSKDAPEVGSNKAILLNSVKIEGTGLVKESLRIHFLSNTSNFIYNPNSQLSGSDAVGGVLDLNLDGYYDSDSKNQEYVYGEAENITYNAEPSSGLSPIPEEERTTFNGTHKSGTYGVDLTKTTFKKANYLGNDDVLIEKVLASSNEGEDFIRLDMCAYLEGWSPYMNQLEHKNYFSMTLNFELADL